MPLRSARPRAGSGRRRGDGDRARLRRVRHAGSGAAAARLELGGAAVVTSFYPIQFATQQITGGAVPVSVLTKPGAEPHDLELAPQDIAGMTKARLVVYADGFQPAVDEAVADVQPTRSSTSPTRPTCPSPSPRSPGTRARPHAQHDDHGHAGSDPHFWLDPQRYAAVARGHRRAPGEGRPRPRGGLREEHRDLRRASFTTLDDELRLRPRVVPLAGARHQPRGLRLPGRSATASSSTASPASRPRPSRAPRASRRSPTSCRSHGRDDDLPGDPRRAALRRDGGRLDGRDGRDARPARGHHVRVRRHATTSRSCAATSPRCEKGLGCS